MAAKVEGDLAGILNIAALGTDVSHKPKVSLKRSGTIAGKGGNSASSAARTDASAVSPNKVCYNARTTLAG